MSKIENSQSEKSIYMDDLDPDFKHMVAREPGGENIKKCFACGTCSAICPVLCVNERYDPRKIIHMVILGMKDEVLKSKEIWLCSGCYSCYERCPRDVHITTIMNALRNIAVKEGYIPEPMKVMVEILKKSGRLLEISEFENTMRKKKDMPILEPTISEIEKVFECTGIEEAIKGDAKND